MQWNGNFQIESVSGAAPESDRGPALTAGNGVVYLAYSGNGGENLYLSSCPVDPKNPGALSSTRWKQTQMKFKGGKTPQANDRPAVALWPLAPLVVYTTEGRGQVCSAMFTDEQWLDLGLITAFPSNLSFRQPLLTTCNYDTTQSGIGTVLNALLHLVAMADNGDLWSSTQLFELGATGGVTSKPWTPATKIEIPSAVKGVVNWSLTTLGQTSFLFGFLDNLICAFRRGPTDTAWQQFLTQGPPGVLIEPWASAAPFGSSIDAVFTRKGQADLYSASSAGDISQPDLVGLTPIAPNGHAAKTGQAPGACWYPDANALLIAYRGDTSGRLYLAYAQ